MARPRKTGLEYFPFDVDFFSDEKIVCIAGEFGIKGLITAISLLCAIYRNGYFMEWSEMMQFRMLRDLPGVSHELLKQVVRSLVKWNFFNKALFDSANILTSVGIQRRYFEITRRRVSLGELPYLLVSVAETPVSVAETPVPTELIPQIKENKTKINKTPPLSPPGGSERERDSKKIKKRSRPADTCPDKPPAPPRSFGDTPQRALMEAALEDSMWKSAIRERFSLSNESCIATLMGKFAAWITSIGELDTLSTTDDVKRRFSYWYSRQHGRSPSTRHQYRK